MENAEARVIGCNGVRAIANVMALAEEEVGEIEKAARILAERTVYSAEETTQALINIILAMGNGLMVCKELLAMYAIDERPEQGAPLNFMTAWARKEAREKRRAVERETTSRFRQYKARESAWVAQKRTRPRQREWRGPWRSEKN
ncbi:MAG: hypothetical protein HDT35_01095 [Clostridiales bacterium]|nr:hypothetical protein [Clostridiales bacterium]